MMCSTISTVASPRWMAVRRWRGTTFLIDAATDGEPGMSTRRKTTPASGSAGRKRTVTSAPVRKPTPRTEASEANVFCRRLDVVIRGLVSLANAGGWRAGTPAPLRVPERSRKVGSGTQVGYDQWHPAAYLAQ